ncbi:variable large family protein [Borrelia crocidurae]|nr:variable large family protein [Borrelia crocidurae]
MGIMMMMVMMVMGCNSGGVKGGEGKVNLEAKNSFLESLVKIGEGFQEIFSDFGSAVGDALGFSVVRSGDKRSKVGEHFKEIGNGLTTTKNKLKELEGKISEAKNAEGVTIEAVKGAIEGVNDVFTQLIASLTKLAGVTNDGAVDIGDTANADTTVAADKAGVDSIIAEVKSIIEVAEKSGIEIRPGNPGVAVANANGPKVLIHNAAPGAGDGPKLADEVSKADAWAMIDKIKNAKTTAAFTQDTNNEAGVLATGAATATAAGAKTNADLAAAVALKAITKGGKLSATANEVVGVKAAGVSAANKVLRILDLIIRKIVNSNLDKVREAVKGIKYSETTGEAVEAVITTK